MATIDVINPATAETIGAVPNMTADEVRRRRRAREAGAARVARRNARSAPSSSTKLGADLETTPRNSRRSSRATSASR